MPKKFLLKAGTFAAGGVAGRRWQANKNVARIVESDDNLAELYPEKFEVYKGDDAASAGVRGPEAAAIDAASPSPASPTARHQARAGARAESKTNLPTASAEGEPAEDEAVPAERQEVDDGLDDMTVVELKELADKEDVDLSGAHLKAEIIEAIRKSREEA